MRLFIDDHYIFPDAAPDDLQRAFDAFEQITEWYATLAEQISDLDMAVDLGKRQMTFTGFIDRGDGEPPRFYVGAGRDLMGKFASAVMLECDLPRTIYNNRTELAADDGSFTAVAELTFTVPAP